MDDQYVGHTWRSRSERHARGTKKHRPATMARVMGAALAMAVAVALLAAHCGGDGVRVERLRLPLEEDLTLVVNSTVEYIVELAPTAEQALWPSRLRAQLAAGAEAEAEARARPVLLTARRGTAAATWQLPPPAPEPQGAPLERTLCPADDDDAAACDGEAGGAGAWTLHVSAACAADAVLRLRAGADRDWLLADGQLGARQVALAQGAPRLLRYRWPTTSTSGARLVLHSDDDVCATVAITNYTCPLPQSLAEVQQSGGLRMTMLRSGAAHVKRSAFPLGFVVVLVVQPSGEACGLEEQPAAARPWLWGAALDQAATAAPATATDALVEKHVTVTVQEALPGSQYAVASAVTLAVFLSFYVVAGGLVLGGRWRRKRGPAGAEQGAQGGGARLERRGSGVTFDSDDVSDSEEEEAGAGAAGGEGAAGAEAGAGAGAEAAAEAAAGAGGFGLPARLRLAALSRRRARTLAARSRRYLQTLLVVAVFYALPVLQLVAAFQLLMTASGELDLCYYNFQCAHPLGPLSDFNHMLSNAGYVLLGALFAAQVHLKRRPPAAKAAEAQAPVGIPPHRGLLASLGAGLVVLGVLSASYHVCPNRLNFQFDTAFMYVLAVLVMVTLYQARHPDVNARAHATFGALAALMALVVGGVLGGGAAFWAVWSALHVLAALLLSLRVYYLGQFRLAGWRRQLAGGPKRPAYAARLAALLAANAANWAFAVYGLVTQPADFASHLLAVLLGNALLALLWYLASKLAHGERPPWRAWALLAAAAVAWPAALAFFLWGSSDWSAAPALSRHRNHPCLLLGFFDAHDLWHALSAVALYLTFSAMLVWDDDLATVPRDRIAVF